MSLGLLKYCSNRLKNYLQLDNNEIKKLIMLGLSFFFIISSYSILRSLKTSIFLGLVGVEYQPYTRFITPILMIPCMFFYSKLVDHLKRHQIVYVILCIYAFLSIIFTFLFLHPVYGIQNTMAGPDRIL